jgi:hypothetical protein
MAGSEWAATGVRECGRGGVAVRDTLAVAGEMAAWFLHVARACPFFWHRTTAKVPTIRQVSNSQIVSMLYPKIVDRKKQNIPT